MSPYFCGRDTFRSESTQLACRDPLKMYVRKSRLPEPFIGLQGARDTPVLFGQRHLAQQGTKTPIAAQRFQQRIALDVRQAAVTLAISTHQPIERFGPFPAPREDLCDLVARLLRVPRQQVLEGLLRLAGMSERVLRHRDSLEPEALEVHLVERLECLLRLAFQ